MTFTTFGDGPSIPRLHGIPDVFDGPAEDGLAFLKNDAAAYGAVQGELIAYIEEATADAGRIMTALAAAPLTEAALRARVSLPAARFDASLRFLESLEYIRKTGDTYDVAVPVLTPRDKPMLDSALALSRRIMTDWLAANHASMEHDLSGLSSVRDGLPFAAPFSEIWHYVFGMAAKSLAADNFFADPRSPKLTRDTGYVPLVWATLLSIYRAGLVGSIAGGTTAGISGPDESMGRSSPAPTLLCRTVFALRSYTLHLPSSLLTPICLDHRIHPRR